VRSYFALIEQEKNRFGVTFPDLPGCVAEADTQDHAIVRAREALALFLDAYAAEGIAIPRPRSFGTLSADTEVKAALRRRAVMTLVPVLNEPDERERINVMFSKNLLTEIDAAAETNGMTRSAFLERAAYEKLHGSANPVTVKKTGRSATAGSTGLAEPRRKFKRRKKA
jgi:predicted RNase H-like HicB family nuclease